MMTRMICTAAVLIAISSFPIAASAAEEPKLSGAILKLSEIADKPFTVNVGGLVIAIVRDSGSRPPQNIKVDTPRAYQALGVVRGTQNEQGQALMGGGYTWYLFTPVTAGETTIKVSYTENGDGGKEVERIYKVNVQKQN
jgi:hypothetical protein